MRFHLVLPCVFLAMALSCVIPVTGQEQAAPKYRNPNVPVDDRVADLLSRMTLEVKVHEISGGGEAQAEVIYPTGTFTTEQARVAFAQWWDPDYVLTARRSAL